jgi:hypothetical protein
MARSRKPAPPAARSFGVFRPKERLIYRYHDGQRDRLGDPLEIVRRLTGRDGFSLDIDGKLAFGETPEAPKALERLVEAVRDVFGVKRLEDGGMTESECLGLLLHFMEYVAEVQRDLAPLPTSPVPTGCPAGNGSTTTRSSDCGSTASAP